MRRYQDVYYTLNPWQSYFSSSLQHESQTLRQAKATPLGVGRLSPDFKRVLTNLVGSACTSKNQNPKKHLQIKTRNKTPIKIRTGICFAKSVC
jgi:hypothetical protein